MESKNDTCAMIQLTVVIFLLVVIFLNNLALLNRLNRILEVLIP